LVNFLKFSYFQVPFNLQIEWNLEITEFQKIDQLIMLFANCSQTLTWKEKKLPKLRNSYLFKSYIKFKTYDKSFIL